MRKRGQLLIFIFIFLLAFFLRFNQLGEVPPGLQQDETAIGYNAFSISQTLRDEHDKFLPLYFKSFGEYKLPVYIYLTIVPIKLFGLNEFAVRFPAAIFGLLTVVVFYFFVQEITKNKNLSLVAMALLAINPWHLHYSRATFEVSISLFLFVLGGLLLYKAFFDSSKGAFLFGTLCFILNIYTYNVARILSPVLLALFILIARSRITNLAKKELIITTLTSIVFLIPFLGTLLQSGGISSASGTLIFSSAQVQSQLLEFRSYLVNFPQTLIKLSFNMFALTIWQYLGNVVSYFSAPFFFVSGSAHGNHGIGNVGQFYLFEFPLMIIGFIKIIRERTKWVNLLLLWIALVILIASLTREAPHATRSFFLVVPLEVFSALGVLTLWVWRGKIKNTWGRWLFLVFVVLVIYNLLYYFVSYYVRFPIAYARPWRTADKTLSLYLGERQNKYEKIIFDRKAGFIYTSLLFYLQYPPFEFQKWVLRAPDDSEGFSEVLSFGKYEFRDIDWSKDYQLKNTLFITSEAGKPGGITPLRVFNYPKRPVVISVKGEIAQYPIEEVAYVVLESEEQR